MQSGQLELDNLSEPLDVFYDEKKSICWCFRIRRFVALRMYQALHSDKTVKTQVRLSSREDEEFSTLELISKD